MNKALFAGLTALAVASGCALVGTSSSELKNAYKAFELKTIAANPEAVTLHSNFVYFSANNFKLNKSGSILRITPDDKLERIVNLPTHKDGSRVSPLGLAWGPDGHLYVCDNQFSDTSWGKSCLWRIEFDKDIPKQALIVAKGFNHINGIAVKGNDIFVTETVFKRQGDTTLGAVYKFTVAELAGIKPPLTVKMDPSDTHCLLTITTQAKKGYPFSANGLTFDQQGDLYVCSFGDGVLWKATLDATGKVLECKPFVDAKKTAGLITLDGAHFDETDQMIWVADLLGNAIGKICPKTGKVTVVAKAPIPNDGPSSALDTPADVIRRGNKLYVVNYNLGFGAHVATDDQSIAVIHLDPPAIK